MNNAQLINQTSGSVDWFTPAPIVETARRVMGGIDLDPASSPAANEIVKARYIYTKERNGLQRPWFGNVWMNHPFGRQHNAQWIDKLISEHKIGRVRQACCITFASTSEGWFQPLFDYPLCFLSPRTNYLGVDGRPVRGVTKGSVVAGIGVNLVAFVREFGKLGRVMRPCKIDA